MVNDTSWLGNGVNRIDYRPDGILRRLFCRLRSRGELLEVDRRRLLFVVHKLDVRGVVVVLGVTGPNSDFVRDANGPKRLRGRSQGGKLLHLLPAFNLFIELEIEYRALRPADGQGVTRRFFLEKLAHAVARLQSGLGGGFH